MQSLERFTLQNDQMLRVGLGPDVLATKGAMVAYVGQVEFHHEKSGAWPSWPRRSSPARTCR